MRDLISILKGNLYFYFSNFFSSNLFYEIISLSTLFYNNNCGHRYVVQMTACDNGKPNRCSTALVFVPLQNANCHAPQYTAPVIILAAITLKKSAQLGILNAWDIDGDRVTYHMDPSSEY